MGEYQLLRMARPGAAGLALLMIAGLAHAETPIEYLKGFCAAGERVPGTAGHRAAKDYIVKNLNNPAIDSFFERGAWFYNVSKSFGGKGRIIGIGAHWDSEKGSPGANDGGSGVALLLSLADTLEKYAPDIGVELVFFDGEDIDEAELVGSLHYAAQCIEAFSFFLVVDMVGDKDLKLYKEGNSYKFFPELVDSLWEIGAETAPNIFSNEVRYYIKDDHMALIRYGIRAVDVIDFDYSYWHTDDDTIDKCSAQSLDTMYKFLLKIVYPLY
ncbi:MAG TPA: M28 family peptidase [bacterium]